MYGTPEQARASLVAAGSATLFAAFSGVRHHITQGLVMVSVGTGAATFGLYETDASGSGTLIIGPLSASAPVIIPFDFGERGWAASSTGSRISAVVGASDASVFANVTGYKR